MSQPAIAGGRYRAIERLGQGGMGEVLTARDEQIGRDVALKRMRSTRPNDAAVERFMREATIQGRLEHPAIVPVHDVGRDADGLPYFTMKKLVGTTLRTILREQRDRFSRQRLLRAFADVCLAVEFAHVRGVVHRDLKPDNIVLGEYGEVYVLDWGVAKVIGVGDLEFADVASGSGDDSNTRAGAVIGTPGYIAPEQIHGASDVDGRADVYSLGCMLFEILSRQTLHPRGLAGLDSALGDVDARPSQHGADVPPELDALCVAATAKAREQRLPTARVLGESVQRFLDGDRDLKLRQQLAVTHLDRARVAFACASDGHQDAMREAAAALALDPTLAGAAELIGRIMLEPPTVTPREVEDTIAADEQKLAKTNARTAMRAYLAFSTMLPVLYVVGPSGYFLALALLAAVNVGLNWWNSRPHTVHRPWLVLAANATVVLAASRAFTPFLVAPGLAAVMAMAIVFSPGKGALRPAVVAAVMGCAVLLPWLLERVHAISTTTTATPGGLELQLAAISDGQRPVLEFTALYVLLLVAAASSMAVALRQRSRTYKLHAHMQAWQLRQLVPAARGA